MKITIEEHTDTDDMEVIIKCSHIDERVHKLIAQIQQHQHMMKAMKENEFYTLSLEDIHYFESVDDQTYIYTKDDVYRCEQKLYELETQLAYTKCVRISKACIVNCECLVYVKPLFDGKFEAVTSNHEKLIINRHYVKRFKEVFGL